jgi:two-component system CheB/CheR fusion protein
VTDGPDPKDWQELRRRAEERSKERAAREPRGDRADAQSLLQELEVHQIELEMQNEELLAARRESEAALRRYTEIFDFAPIAYFVMDGGGTIRGLNLAGARLLGRERSRLVGRPVAAFVAAEQRKALVARLGRIFAGGDGDEPERFDLTLLGAGPAREVHVTGAILEGVTPMALCAMEDITDRRRAEAELRAETRNKDAFLAVLSHELRNPLSPIRHGVHLLSIDETLGERAREVVPVIERQVEHLCRLVDDLLDLTRISAGKIHLKRERLELGEIVRRTMDAYRRSFEERRIRLEARFSSDLLWVDGDRTRLAQVLGNLLGNAAKFTPRDGRVDVLIQRRGEQVEIAVRDTGVGIERELREKLFRPFAQGVQDAERTQGGLGLGLWMAKSLIELHNGSVEVASEGVGRGATFTMRLPLQRGPVPAPATPRAEVAGRRILVIEDNVDGADMLRTLLEIEGHEVQVACDGPSGLAVAAGSPPDIILCDVGLPGMNGYAVAHAVRADERLRRAYLVALSGYALPEDLQRAADAGFDTHLAKPASVEKLRAVLAAALPAAAHPSEPHGGPPPNKEG